MSHNRKGFLKLQELLDSGDQEAVTVLLLISKGMSKPPLFFKTRALDALIEFGILESEDRDDGRYYGLTRIGLAARAGLEDVAMP